MPRTLVLVLVAALLPRPAATQTSPHDVTTYPVVLSVPGAADVVERRGVPYADGVRLDLYVPPGPGPAGGWPVVLFANGVGDVGPRKLKDWEIYQSWARLVAAHGAAAATMEAEGGRTGERIAQAVAHLRDRGAVHGVDGTRIALWACSANVTAALPYAMGDAPLRAAVVYYGFADVGVRADLPVFYVLAGKDAPALNDGIRRLWAKAVERAAPWTMVLASELPHAFDALVDSDRSRAVVRDTVQFLVRHLQPAAPAAEMPLARRALAHASG